MKLLVLIAGIAAVLFGLLFKSQGLGLVRWPAESFMIGQTQWVYYGAIIAIFGGLLVFWHAVSDPAPMTMRGGLSILRAAFLRRNGFSG